VAAAPISTAAPAAAAAPTIAATLPPVVAQPAHAAIAMTATSLIMTPA
jgi:hypothetical protein